MVNMLIFNGVLLLGVVRYSNGNPLMGARWRRDSASPTGSTAWSANNSEGKKFVIAYSGVSASDMSPAATTVHTIPTVDPSPSSTYNPYHRKGPNGSPAQLSYRQQVAAPNNQAGFQPSQAQALPNRAQSYSTPYPQPGNTQFQTKASKGNEKSQYFSNPSSYRLYPEPGNPQFRSSQFPVPGGGFPTFPKFKSSSKFPSIASSDYSFENPVKYRFVSGPAFNAQSSSQRPPAYKSNPQPSPKNIGSSPVSLHSSPDVSTYIKALESEPIFLSTGRDYEAHPSSSGLNYDYPKAHSASLADGGPGAFNPNAASYQPLVVPIHSSRSTPQLPQYQAATVNGFAGNRNSQLDAAYQQLANQPQLHFTTGAPTQTSGTFQPIVYHSNPLEKIRTDVELIDKKTTTASPFDSDENDFDQVFKTAGSDFPYLATDGGSSQSLKSLSRDNSFELPSSNLFNSYDQAFGKYSKLASLERENTPKFTPSPLDDASKPVYQSIKEDDEADDDEDKSSGEYRSNYEEKDSNASYEDENEEESRRSEKKGSFDDKRQDNDDDDESASYSSYGHDFEKEFEDSYRKDLPKSDYVHVKQVPEVEESNTESRRQRPATRISRLASNRHVTNPNEKSKKIVDSQGYASRSSYKSAKTNEPRIEDSFGYKIPRDRGTKRFASNDDDDYRTAEKEKTSEGTSTSTLTPIADLQSYTFPAFDDWKATSKLPNNRGSHGTSRQDVRAFFDAESSPKIFPQGHRGSLTFSSNGQAPRDLTGI